MDSIDVRKNTKDSMIAGLRLLIPSSVDSTVRPVFVGIYPYFELMSSILELMETRIIMINICNAALAINHTKSTYALTC